jgi:two-component system chemotaxis sensor kinase CheA
VDLAKYRAIFVEEATEHLAEMSRALLSLEKQPAHPEAIDVVFRMAHSIKGMAASLEYEGLSQVAHALEDRMQRARSAGRLEPEELAPLFRGLEALEGMVAEVRDRGEPPAPRPELVRELSNTEPGPEPPGKKALGPPRRARTP